MMKIYAIFFNDRNLEDNRHLHIRQTPSINYDIISFTLKINVPN